MSSAKGRLFSLSLNESMGRAPDRVPHKYGTSIGWVNPLHATPMQIWNPNLLSFDLWFLNTQHQQEPYWLRKKWNEFSANIRFGQPWLPKRFCWTDGVISIANEISQDDWHFADDIFKCIFFHEILWISIKISLKFVGRVPIDNKTALVQAKACAKPHYLHQWSPSSVTPRVWHIFASSDLSELIMINFAMTR